MRRRRLVGSDESGENFWPSFADLTSTIALILFVLVLLAYLQNLISGKNLERARTELEQTLARLQASQQQVSEAQAHLAGLQGQIEAGRAAIRLSRQRLEQQAQVIADSSRELREVRARVQGIGLLRLTVLEKVKASLEEQLGGQVSAPVARIADNGNIVLDESLLFEYNSHTIKDEGRPFLDSLGAAFENVLADPQVRENIDVVLIQGHTDERGSSRYNRELSARRANAVLDYLFEARTALEGQYGRFFASSAYSEFRPLSNATTEEAYRQNRRIEISVVLKDSGVREVIDDYLGNIDPSLAETGPDTDSVPANGDSSRPRPTGGAAPDRSAPPERSRTPSRNEPRAPAGSP